MLDRRATSAFGWRLSSTRNGPASPRPCSPGTGRAAHELPAREDSSVELPAAEPRPAIDPSTTGPPVVAGTRELQRRAVLAGVGATASGPRQLPEQLTSRPGAVPGRQPPPPRLHVEPQLEPTRLRSTPIPSASSSTTSPGASPARRPTPPRRAGRRDGAPCCARHGRRAPATDAPSSRASAAQRSVAVDARLDRALASSSSGVTRTGPSESAKSVLFEGPKPDGRSARARSRAVQSFATREPADRAVGADHGGEGEARSRAPRPLRVGHDPASGPKIGRGAPEGEERHVARARTAGKTRTLGGYSTGGEQVALRERVAPHARARRPPPVKNAWRVCAASWTIRSPSILPGQPRSSSMPFAA